MNEVQTKSFLFFEKARAQAKGIVQAKGQVEHFFPAKGKGPSEKQITIQGAYVLALLGKYKLRSHNVAELLAKFRFATVSLGEP